MKDLCKVWQFKGDDGRFQDYPDLICIVFNIQYEKFNKSFDYIGKDQTDFQQVSFLKGSTIDFKEMIEITEGKTREIRQ